MPEKVDPNDVFASFQDILGDLFGGSRGRSKDASLALSISLIEAAHGTTRHLERDRGTRCARCEGKGGRPGAELVQCPACASTGKHRETRGAFAIDTSCSTCRGAARTWRPPCDACAGRGETLARVGIDVKVPPGVAAGTVLRLAGQGDDLGQGRGDLHVVVEIAPHPTLERVGDDLHARVRFDAVRAARGGTLIVPWLEGTARVAMPAGTQPGDALRLPGWGCVKLGASYAPPPTTSGSPYRTASATRGDLVVTLVEVGSLAAAFRVLGLRASASRPEVEAAYRRLALVHRPDRHPEREDAPAHFAKIHAAYAEITRVTAEEPTPTPSSARAIAIVSSTLAIAGALAYWLLR